MPLTFGSALFFSIISLIATFIYFGMRSRLKTESAGVAHLEVPPRPNMQRSVSGDSVCSIRWRIVQSSADDLYRDYREFDNVRDSLVTRELDAALNEVFASYDPLATVDTNGKSTAKSLDELSEEVTTRLRLKVGDQVEVLSVIIPLVSFDKTTQDKINDYQAELANTRIAKQRQQTADAEAEANRKLSGSVSNDPNVLVSKCFDTLKDMVRSRQQIPAGFSCWPGGGSSVVIPSAKN